MHIWVALEAILAVPGEMITDEQGREFVAPPSVVVERDKTERDRLTICIEAEKFGQLIAIAPDWVEWIG